MDIDVRHLLSENDVDEVEIGEALEALGKSIQNGSTTIKESEVQIEFEDGERLTATTSITFPVNDENYDEFEQFTEALQTGRLIGGDNGG